MALNNTYVLDVDLKRQMTQRVPKFRKGDKGILIFKMFDDGIEYDIGSVTKAELYHKTSKGNIIQSNCDFIQHEGKRAIRYEYEDVAMVETGINETLLVVYEGDKAVSIQPFPVVIYSDFKGGADSFIGMIRDLQDKIHNLVLDLNQTIKLGEKGKPNGVATLDATGKIPQSQLPPQLETYIKHIPQTVWKNQVHGLRITKPEDDGIGGNLQYETNNNSWQNVGFADSAVGGSGNGTQLLDVELTKSNGVVTLKYIGTPTVQLQKWSYGDFNKPHFLVNGTTFTGNEITVDKTGLYTLYYKDSNGLEYVRLFNIATSDLATPSISVNVENGDVTVNISTATSIKKWAKGKQTIGYFQSQGTAFTGNTFNVTEVGWYTIYYKTTAGVEYVYEFEVTASMLSGSISELPTYTEFTIGTYNAVLLDPSTGMVMIKDYINKNFDADPSGTTSTNKYSPNKNTHIAHYLNNTFYSNLISSGLNSSDVKDFNWGIGGMVGSEIGFTTNMTPVLTPEQMRARELSETVNAKIGLLSGSEYRKYSLSFNPTYGYTNFVNETGLITPDSSGNTRIWSSLNQNLASAGSGGKFNFYPVFYLRDSSKIIDGKYMS